MTEIQEDARIYVAGHAGAAVVRRLRSEGFTNILTATRAELDLREQGAVDRWFAANRPEYVFLVAGTVEVSSPTPPAPPSSSTTT